MAHLIMIEYLAQTKTDEQNLEKSDTLLMRNMHV